MDLRTRRPFLLETLSAGGIDLEVNNKPQPWMNNFSGSELLQKSLYISPMSRCQIKSLYWR